MPIEAEAPPAYAGPHKGSVDKFMTSLGDFPTPDKPTNIAIADPPNPGTTPPPAKIEPDPAKPAEHAKPAVTPPADPAKVVDDDGDDTVPRTAVDWKARKQKQKERLAAVEKERDDARAALETEKKALTVEIETLRKSGPSPELDAIRKERDELSEKLRVTDITNHPKFKAYFEEKTNAQIALAKSIVGAANAEQVVQILNQPEGVNRDREIEDVMSSLSPLAQSRLGAVVNHLAEINSERQTEIERAKTNFDQIRASEKTQSEATTKKRTEAYQSAFDATIKKAQDPKEGSIFFRKIEGNDAHNKTVDDRVALAKSLMFGQLAPDAIANTVMYATMTPDVLKHNVELQGKIATLEAQIKSLSAASPTILNGGDAKPGEDPAPARMDLHVGMRPSDASAKFFERIRKDF